MDVVVFVVLLFIESIRIFLGRKGTALEIRNAFHLEHNWNLRFRLAKQTRLASDSVGVSNVSESRMHGLHDLCADNNHSPGICTVCLTNYPSRRGTVLCMRFRSECVSPAHIHLALSRPPSGQDLAKNFSLYDVST